MRGESAVDLWESAEAPLADVEVPVLQEVRLQVLRGNAVIAAVGQSNRGHWSLTVESAAEESTLVFEFAARLREPPGHVACVYRRIGHDGHECVLLPEIQATDLRCGLEESGERSLVTVPRATGSFPATIRFRYCWKYALSGV
jgi:hypothetical protein